MKIFATADIHGNKIIIDKLEKLADKVDLILICGDIGGKDIRGKTLQQFSQYQKQEAHYLCKTLNNINISSRFILGNDDWFEIEDRNYLSTPEIISDRKFIPFEFVSTTPFNTNREVNENKLNYELHKLEADNNAIIVAHTPPFGAGDMIYSGARVGSQSVANWIKKTRPLIWLNGHIHEDYSMTEIGNTLVFNCACYYQDDILRGWLIDTHTMSIESVNM